MNLLFAASECSPYAKTGGLGDVLGALPPVLRERGHSVSVVFPLYRGLLEKLPEATLTSLKLSIPLGGAIVSGQVWTATAATGVRLFLIQQDEFFNRESIYGSPFDYPDNVSRFLFFSKAVVELARHVQPVPQIIHGNDWQTGLIPAFIKAQGLPFKTVFSIHNLAFQGAFPASDFALTNLSQDYFTPARTEFYGTLNSMKAGIAMADQVTTVSPRYAEEIRTEAYGCGLNAVLEEHRRKLTGILNGVDARLWNPRTDGALAAPFHSGNLKGKAACKEALRAEFEFEHGDAPIFAAITRLTTQKGVELIESILEGLLERGVRFVLLGSGESRFEGFFRSLALRRPGQVGVKIGFDESLAHRIIAGADFFLMPSLFEPCGLTQLYSLRYGTLPIVHRTGGLVDSVVDYNPKTKANGTGFIFSPHAPGPFAEACERALALYKNKPALLKVRRHAMAREFSWDQSAAAYEAVYERALA